MAKNKENQRLMQLNTLADYVEEIINQELAEAGLIDEGRICVDCMELALYNDYLHNLFNLRVDLRNRIAEEEHLLKQAAV